MKLRPYEDKDFEQVIQLWWDAWHSSSGYKHPQPIDAWKARWFKLEETHRIVVIENDSEVVAFAALDLKNKILSQIFVSPKYKRQGLGKQLIQWVSLNCINRFSLKTAIDNNESRAFYKALSMVEGSRSINDFNGREEIEYEFGIHDYDKNEMCDKFN